MMEQLDQLVDNGWASITSRSAALRVKNKNVKLALCVVTSAYLSILREGFSIGVQEYLTANMSNNIHNNTLHNTTLTLHANFDAKSNYNVGSMIGGLLAGYITNRMGRKKGLLWSNCFVIFGFVLQACSKITNYAVLLIMERFYMEFCYSIYDRVVALYLAEQFTSKSIRAIIGLFYRHLITILLSRHLRWESIFGTPNYWPYLLMLMIILSAIQWVSGEDKNEEAEKNVTLWTLLSNHPLRQHLIIPMMVIIALEPLEICSKKIFITDIDGEESLANVQQYIRYLNVVMTLVSGLLVEKFGRKTLLLTGFIGMFITTVGLFITNQYTHVPSLHFALVILFMMSSAIAPCTIIWSLFRELFKKLTCTEAVTVNIALFQLSSLSLLLLPQAFGGILIIFAVLLIFMQFIAFKLPEPKNNTIDKITTMFLQLIP
ncbi:solute carrier family 2, facilitated glucose transporter member 5-like [Achroia grisella]|uniref:solute carrier family 2, facilitated glucose transporter member 5-like n=1 Tax=Achroia grisella TaxID=688607 RepID=UPI0027D3034B|nr:solute carrier family 2, facilitated glucose transporter member 5-like [Achroia grisella]